MTSAAEAGAEVRLEARDVSAGYGGVDIIHGASVVARAGEIVTIIGPNGAGKSTLLRAIFGTLRLSAGQVLVRGVDVTGRSAHEVVRAGAAFVPQTENVFPSLSIRENLEMGGYRQSGDLNARITGLLERFPDLARRPGEQAARLSGGQRQALAICRALMVDPAVLLLDEPSAALSPIMRDGIFRQIEAIRDSGVAVLMVEQNAREALAISDRGYVMVGGRVVLEQSGREMLDNPEVGRLFLGRAQVGTGEA